MSPRHYDRNANVTIKSIIFEYLSQKKKGIDRRESGNFFSDSVKGDSVEAKDALCVTKGNLGINMS